MSEDFALVESTPAAPAAVCWVRVALDVPLPGPFDYRHHEPVEAGLRVIVPFGRRKLIGVVVDNPAEPSYEPKQIKPIEEVLRDLPPFDEAWLRLARFAAEYYQRPLGEVMLPTLPPPLRKPTAYQGKRSAGGPVARLDGRKRKAVRNPAEADQPPELNDAQREAVETIAGLAKFKPVLLYGVTGSGKTEVYLRTTQAALDADPGAQVLVMVPEINLTPQLEQRFTERFAPQYGAACVVSMHSAMTNPQRLKSWLAAHTGVARIVLGTRMSVFASLPGLSLIVVDEEHDASYKQQEGARYSARDLAIWRARDTGAKVILGSATPSLESWHASRPPNADEPQGGRYLRLHMPSRIGAAALPRVRLVDMGQQPRKAVFSPPLIDAITERVQRGEQSLVLLNRRGFAPVLFCADCGWKSDCPHCSAHQVFHKADRTLRCHHCGYTQRVPMACPGCGNPDILPLGKGTEQLEEELARLLRNVQRPDREPARVARIDADTTRAKGALEEQLAQVHAGDIDVLVGTQMVAKGHDFRRITLVAAVQPDSALFSSDYRAPERLFSLLMQAAGRAGRDAHYVAAQGSHPEMWIQTHDPSHPVYTALRSHDYPAFAARQLRERRDAGMPPFAFQAIVRADARTQEAAQAFLAAAAEAARQAGLPHVDDVFLYPPIPMSVQRVANVERAQMLIESAQRPALLRFLWAWQAHLHWIRAQPGHRALVRWLVDVDPLAI